LRLGFLLAALGSLSSLAAQHAAAMPVFLFLRAAGHGAALLFAHHTFAGGALSLGAGAHAALFLLRGARAAGALRIAAGRAAEHLSWAALWLGFHTLALFVHNDSAAALPPAGHQLLLRPALGECAHAAAGGALFADLGPGDFLAHHAIALGLHTSTLVLAKGAARARASRHMPDKAAHGFGFACDGPGRGGSCDVSGWDSAYLGAFWVLNAPAWTLFYAHWKSLGGGFAGSSPALLGWFRDYLWHPCSTLVRGYGLLGADEAAPAAWAFLLAHLCWAAGPMPLASWRGYWQEVLDILVYLHLRSPALSSLWQGRVAPAALSIVQARAAGLAHFAAGFAGTYYCFLP
jgi:photosystem I P700 chlorophyll a apoprotein A2